MRLEERLEELAAKGEIGPEYKTLLAVFVVKGLWKQRKFLFDAFKEERERGERKACQDADPKRMG